MARYEQQTGKVEMVFFKRVPCFAKLSKLGYVPFSRAGAELLFEVISQAYEQYSIIVTSNLPFEEWPEIFGSERLTGALLDRLTHRCHILEANGEIYRLNKAKQRIKLKQPNKK